MMRPVSHVDWLIWSSDHGGWSKPNRHGYTNRLADAGRYSFDEALEIVQDANSGTFARNFPSETMGPAGRKKNRARSIEAPSIRDCERACHRPRPWLISFSLGFNAHG